jgi:hypothetical protein
VVTLSLLDTACDPSSFSLACHLHPVLGTDLHVDVSFRASAYYVGVVLYVRSRFLRMLAVGEKHLDAFFTIHTEKDNILSAGSKHPLSAGSLIWDVSVRCIGP